MKKILLATSAIVAAVVAAPAGAADLRAPIMKAPPIVRPACAQFGGWYIGGHVGGAYYNNSWNDLDAWGQTAGTLEGSVDHRKSGFIGGVQGGYNWQTNCTVFGIQADYAWSSINADSFFSDGGVGAALDTLSVSSKLKGIGTVRARTGVVVDNLMIYVTGGFAYAEFDRSATVTNNVAGVFLSETFQSNKTKWGGVLGVGTEWSMWGNWSLQSEVLYAWFEKDTQNHLCASPATCGVAAPLSKRFHHHDDVWITKIGLNYRFGGGPVLANY